MFKMFSKMLINNMKTIKTINVQLVTLNDDEYIPNVMEYSKIYYSKKLKASSHICLCGCGHKCYLPIKENEWYLTINNNGTFTISPSILQRFECRSHYVIVNSKANFI